MQKSFLTAALLCATSFISPAMAWDETGHRAVALIADHYLSFQVRDQVHAMLAADRDTLTAHDIASEATWADKFRDSDENTTKIRYSGTYSWHFADIMAGRPNIPVACFGQPKLPPGTLASQGPAKDCVIDKINQFAAELSDPKQSANERLLALKYLLNLVAEVHEPLNVVNEDGSHGMKLEIQAKDITPGNLYTYWDRVFVRRQGDDPTAIAQKLITQISETDQQQWASAAPQLWALEANELGVDRAYGLLYSVDDHGNRVLEDEYVQRAVQTVGMQLARAGVRLAYVINEALAPTPVAVAKAAAGNPAEGRDYANVICNGCHVVSPNQKDSNREALAPDFQAVANTRGVNDVALREFLFGPHPSMPMLKLTQRQADNLIAYILSLKTAR